MRPTIEQIEQQKGLKRHVLRMSLLMGISFASLFGFAVYQLGFMRDSRYSLLAGVSFGLVLIAVAAMLLQSQMGSLNVRLTKSSVYIMIVAIWVATIMIPVFYSESGFILTLLEVFFVVFSVSRLFSRRESSLIVTLALIVGILATLIDWYGAVHGMKIMTRAELLSAWAVIWITVLIVFLALVALLRRLRVYPLRKKLIFSFMVIGAFSALTVVLVAVGLAQQTLLVASGQTASPQSERVVLTSVSTLVRNLELWALLVIFVTSLVAIPLSDFLIAPLKQLKTVTKAVASGDLSDRASVFTDDELGDLAGAINQLAGELQQTQISLEQRVAERTYNVEKRLGQFQAVAEIGRAAATIRNPDELLPMVTRLISEQFGFYHVGIFLIEEGRVDYSERGEGRVRRYAVLRAANSEGGQNMLRRGHKLVVGEQGIVGYVTGTGKPRIALNVGEDTQYFRNDDLPLTRSEMALPLAVGGKVIGALDVQSVEAGAFARDDVTVMQILADLLAIAIENARLFTESQEALEVSRRAYGELSRRAWMEMLPVKEELSYTSLDYPFLAAQSGQMSDASEETPEVVGQIAPVAERAEVYPLSLPIKVRDTVIGYLETYKPKESGGWTPDEYDMVVAIVDQLGVALESARLYEASQSQAERERLIGEVASRMRESLDVDAVLRTAVQELRRALGISQVEVRLRHSQDIE